MVTPLKIKMEPKKQAIEKEKSSSKHGNFHEEFAR